jgi:hypothetical protein
VRDAPRDHTDDRSTRASSEQAESIMSVHGELTRHLEGLLDALDQTEVPRAAVLAETLRDASPTRSDSLSESAERILAVLADFGLSHGDDRSRTPEEYPAPVLEAARTVGALSRIVLGL